MNSLSLVVEGKCDVALLRRYLPPMHKTHLRFFAAGGGMSLATVARNLLVMEPGDVLVVMDGDSLNRSRVEDDRCMMLAALRSMSDDSRFDVFAFVPAHEILFFEAPQVLQRHLDLSVLTPALLDRGLYDPIGTLETLLKGTGYTLASWPATLTPADGDDLRKGAQGAALVAMLRSLGRSEPLRKSA